MSGTTLVDEYEHASRIGFEFDELAKMALNGFASSFLPFAERQVLYERARAEIAALRAAP
jgi:hypothetical protein